MSHYGSGGGEPDHPDDPYRGSSWQSHGSEPQGGQPGYRPPADPWEHAQASWADLTTPGYGDQPAPDDQPTYRQGFGAPTVRYPPLPPQPEPPRYAGPYPTGQPWQPPPRRTGLVVGLVVLLVLVLAGGVGVTLFVVSGDEDDPLVTDDGGNGSTAPSADPSAGSAGPDSPEDRIGFSATVAQVDDCMVNDGPDDEPVMRIVPCDTDEEGPVYRVLARFNEQVTGTTDEEMDRSAQQICARADGYEYFYRFVGPSEDQSFVLCMVEE